MLFQQHTETYEDVNEARKATDLHGQPRRICFTGEKRQRWVEGKRMNDRRKRGKRTVDF